MMVAVDLPIIRSVELYEACPDSRVFYSQAQKLKNRMSWGYPDESPASLWRGIPFFLGRWKMGIYAL